MINRVAYSKIQYALQHFPAVTILGARQIGKSTIARAIASDYPNSVYLDLEDASDIDKINDAQGFLEKNKDRLVIIDEIQRMPQLYSALRPSIDKHRIPGRFLILGSASPQLVKGVSETLAGRVRFINLDPINLTEAATHGISQDTHWFRGGFPNALVAADNTLMHDWMDDFISTYIERDLSWLFGRDFSRNVMRNFWGMIAHNNGSIWSASAYSNSLGVSAPTVKSYAEFLEAGFLLRLLPAWYLNAGKRLVKSPKIYWRDTGLLHRMCRISEFTDLFSHPVVGGSWEGYVVEQISQHKSRDLDMYYYRTQNGAECDILLVKSIKPIACIEVKLTNTPHVTKGFFNCIGDLKTKQNFIVTQSSGTYPYYGATVCNLASFLNEFLPAIQ
jgi:uncharacterized protein